MICGDIGDAVDVDDGYGERHLAQRSHGHRLLETAQEAAAVELRRGRSSVASSASCCAPAAAARTTHSARSGP